MLRSNKVYFLTLLVCVCEVISLDFKYHNHQGITDYLQNFTQLYPDLNPMLYSIGNSTLGQSLLVLEVTAANRSLSNIPHVKLIGNIHGNEAIGREMLLQFLEFLATNYGKNSRVSWLLNNTRIHIMPTLNPDGYSKSTEGVCGGIDGRNTLDNKDLNRCFPDHFRLNKIPKPKEAIAVIKWMKEIPFILSASLHSGAVVANYPFDTLPDNGTRIEEMSPQLSISADDDVFVHLASTYANAHSIMHKGNNCGIESFEGGITNGAAWYPFLGGMQDYNYDQGCMEVTLEISCCKFPPKRTLEEKWHENKEALLQYCMQANRGVTGQIFDSTTNSPISGAKLKIRGREMYFKSSMRGEFWRILLPGDYTLEVEADGYHPQEIHFTVEPPIDETFPQDKSLRGKSQNKSSRNKSQEKSSREKSQERSLKKSPTEKFSNEKFSKLKYSQETTQQGKHPPHEYPRLTFLKVKLLNETIPLPTTTNAQTTSIQFSTTEQSGSLSPPKFDLANSFNARFGRQENHSQAQSASHRHVSENGESDGLITTFESPIGSREKNGPIDKNGPLNKNGLTDKNGHVDKYPPIVGFSVTRKSGSCSIFQRTNTLLMVIFIIMFSICDT